MIEDQVMISHATADVSIRLLSGFNVGLVMIGSHRVPGAPRKSGLERPRRGVLITRTRRPRQGALPGN